jgi:hypothetical protein
MYMRSQRRLNGLARILPFRTGLARLALFVAVCLFAAGCSDGRPKTVRVTGTVTFNGGQMPGPGMVFFTPIEPAEGYPRRPGTAKFETDGKYAVKTFEEGDGLIPGHYGVAVYCWKKEQTMDNPQGESYLPDRYANGATSGLELVVEEDERRIVFDIPLTEK